MLRPGWSSQSLQMLQKYCAMLVPHLLQSPVPWQRLLKVML